MFYDAIWRHQGCRSSTAWWTPIHHVKHKADLSSAAHSPDSKVHGANMGPTWVLSAPDGPHVGSMNLAIRELIDNAFKIQPFP